MTWDALIKHVSVGIAFLMTRRLSEGGHIVSGEKAVVAQAALQGHPPPAVGVGILY
jgi:hypothetical protein